MSGITKPMELSEADYRLMLVRSWKVREVSKVFSVPKDALRFESSRDSGGDSSVQQTEGA